MSIQSILKIKNIDQTVVLLAVISCFLPFYLSVATMVGLTLYIFIARNDKKKIFGGVANIIFYIFTAISMFTAFHYENWLGMLISGYFLFLIFILNFSSVITDRSFYISILHTVCKMGVVLSFATFTEKLVMAPFDISYRCKAFCFNPNYLSDLLVVCILACAYLELSKKAKPLYCYAVAVICFGALLLAGSMFALVSLLVGISVMLMVMRKHFALSILCLLLSIFFLVFLSSPHLYPRFGDIASRTIGRIKIWSASIDMIFAAPVFGKGFFAYFFQCESFAGAPIKYHSHNLILEILLNFGIVGAVLLFAFFSLFFRRLSRGYKSIDHAPDVWCFVISIFAAAIAHAIADITFLWTQTSLLGAIILGAGLGATIKLGAHKKSEQTEEQTE